MALVAISVVVVTRAASGRYPSSAGWSGHRRTSGATSYGRTLVVKVAVVLIAIALGALNRLRNVAPGRHRRTAAAPDRRASSSAPSVGILLLTATLTSFAPAGERRTSTGSPTPTNDGHGHRQRLRHDDQRDA